MFADSLRDPVSASKSPFDSREFKREAFPLSFISSASSLTCRLAIYSATLANLLIRANELEVSEDNIVMIRALIVEVSVMQFSGAACMRLYAIGQSRNITLNTMGLRDRF